MPNFVSQNEVSATDEARPARRRANRWLVEHVGHMVMAAEPRFIQTDGQAIWRFGAFVTASSHPPLGPIGYVDVDADSLAVLTSPERASHMIEQGQRVQPALSSTES